MRSFLIAAISLFALYQLPACDVALEVHTSPGMQAGTVAQ
jgi:hypothetical protein